MRSGSTMAAAAAAATAALLLAEGVSASAAPTHCCQQGEACWPTVEEFLELYYALDPDEPRFLYSNHNRDGSPIPSAVPIYSPDEQPMYGLGVASPETGLPSPMFVYDDTVGDDYECFSGGEDPLHCLAAVRNNPLGGGEPGVTVFPLTVKHVQTAINFAREHGMCVSVAGTGHDFLDRHSNNGSMFIRTTLMKDYTFNAEDSRHPDGGSVKVGSGTVFHELHKYTADDERYVQSGWATTVGVVGWSTAGGHGPNGAAVGAGVDQLLELEMVTPDGEWKRISANGTDVLSADAEVISHTDDASLFWALRGGGAGAWGVVTTVTYKAYNLPQGGFSKAAGVAGPFSTCDDTSRNMVRGYTGWLKNLSSRISGLTFIQAEPSTFPINLFCPSQFYIFTQQVFQGPATDPEFLAAGADLSEALGVSVEFEINSYNNMWENVQYQAIENIIPVVWTPNGVSSVMIGRENFGSEYMVNLIADGLSMCSQGEQFCGRLEFYEGIPGHNGSPRSEGNSLHPAFNDAIVHLVTGSIPDEETMKPWYELGEASYYSESAWNMSEWQARYWGVDNYNRLLSIKGETDPNGMFWCRHCVGSDQTYNGFGRNAPAVQSE